MCAMPQHVWYHIEAEPAFLSITKTSLFTESAAKYGLDNSGYSNTGLLFDYDMDGDLIVFLWITAPYPVNALNHANNRDLKDGEWKADF